MSCDLMGSSLHSEEIFIATGPSGSFMLQNYWVAWKCCLTSFLQGLVMRHLISAELPGGGAGEVGPSSGAAAPASLACSRRPGAPTGKSNSGATFWPGPAPIGSNGGI
jgi:hypothetical protein